MKFSIVLRESIRSRLMIALQARVLIVPILFFDGGLSSNLELNDLTIIYSFIVRNK